MNNIEQDSKKESDNIVYTLSKEDYEKFFEIMNTSLNTLTEVYANLAKTIKEIPFVEMQKYLNKTKKNGNESKNEKTI